jgi:hypothetical protein
MTATGALLFSILVYSVGFDELAANIVEFGVVGFAVLLAIYGVRLLTRAAAWHLTVSDTNLLKIKDTFPAVVIGEAVSSMIPLGIMISGTAKAVAVRKRVPFVVGFSSVATENIFYSIVTSLFLISGAATFALVFPLDDAWIWTLGVLIAITFGVLVFLVVMVIRQWHFASWTCNWIYDRGIVRNLLENGRGKVRLFEDLVYGFYREHKERFLPILMLEAAFHALGVVEVWFILSRISDSASLLNSFLLESVSRTITIVFKLVPFMVGVDEAGAHFVAEQLGIGAGIGVTIAIIRKGRILFWALVGLVLITKRGLSMAHFFEVRDG